MALSVLMAQALELCVNQALRLEPDAPTLLQPLQGNTLEIEITDWALSVLMVPTQQGFEIYINAETPGICTLSGTLRNFFALAKSTTPQSVISSGRVSVNGDTQVLQRYQTFAKQLHVDWELFLSEIVGIHAAHAIAKPIKTLWQRLVHAGQATKLDISEYLQEEARHLPPKEEVEDWFDDITLFRQSVDRFALRLQRHATAIS